MNEPSRPQYQRRDWDSELRQHGLKLGFEVVAWDGPPTKRSKVLIRCKHKEQWVCPHGQLSKKHYCCRVAAKMGQNNAAFGTKPWNFGTVGVSTGHGFGGKPSPENEGKPAVLALMKYTDSDGEHFKVGITMRDLRRRYGSLLTSVEATYNGTLGECFRVEQAILAEAKARGWRYSSSTTTELIHPDGYSEVREWVLQGGMGFTSQ